MKVFKKHEEITLFLSQKEPQSNSLSGCSVFELLWILEKDFSYFSACLISWLEQIRVKRD